MWNNDEFKTLFSFQTELKLPYFYDTLISLQCWAAICVSKKWLQWHCIECWQLQKTVSLSLLKTNSFHAQGTFLFLNLPPKRPTVIYRVNKLWQEQHRFCFFSHNLTKTEKKKHMSQVEVIILYHYRKKTINREDQWSTYLKN